MTEREYIVPWEIFSNTTAYGDYELLNLIATTHCDIRVKIVDGKMHVIEAIAREEVRSERPG